MTSERDRRTRRLLAITIITMPASVFVSITVTLYHLIQEELTEVNV